MEWGSSVRLEWGVDMGGEVTACGLKGEEMGLLQHVGLGGEGEQPLRCRGREMPCV